MNFLNRIFETIRKFIPRIWLVQPDEAGVRVTLGTRIKVLPPGWYFLWPIFQEIFYTTVTTQVVDLRPQSVLTEKGQNMTVSGIIKYKVTDIQKAMLEVQDYDRSLQALALGVFNTILSTSGETADWAPEKLADQVLQKIREEASGWGLKIQKVYISDFGQVRNIRLLTDRNGE